MRFVEYLKSASGRGLRLIFCFSILVCIFCGGAFYQSMRTIKTDQNILNVLEQLPQLTIKDNRIVSPDNLYREIKLPGSNAVLIFDLSEMVTEPEFDNGIYVTKENIRFKSGDILKSYAITYPDEVMTKEMWLQFMERSLLITGIFLVITLFALIFLGYLFLYLCANLLFWIPGLSISKGLLGRLSAVSWVGVLMVEMVALIFGYAFPLITLFLLALTIVLFGALKLRVKME